MKTLTIEHLRSQAISHSLFEPTSLKNALERLKFVQADPIRSPARAQDLILRQRVKNYRVGDLEARYPALKLEEDFLYAYGFLTRDVAGHLHPRKTIDLTETETKILETVQSLGEAHPRQMEAHFGKGQVINAWGGYSQATTRSLERLHYHGHLRISRRDRGIRIYATAATSPVGVGNNAGEEPADFSERLKKLILVISNIFAPVTVKCLNESLSYFKRSLPPLQKFNVRESIARIVKSGELEKHTVDGIDYLIPAAKSTRREISQDVRILAPFDPLVWDRKRFEHFWGWAYRFEAYTPQHKRQRGYYAMPVLWNDRMIGWANVKVNNGNLDFEIGYAQEKPTDSEFPRRLEEEVERLKYFLRLKD